MTTQQDERAALIERLTASADWLEHGAKTADVPLASGPDLRKAAALLAADGQAGGEAVAWALAHSHGLVFSSSYPIQKSKEAAEDLARRNMGAVKVVPLYTPPQPQAVAQGWKLVPVEPTPEMCRALFRNLVYADDEARVIKAVIAASPAAPAAAQVAQPLTEEQIEQMLNENFGYRDMHTFARAIEAAHGIGKDQG